MSATVANEPVQQAAWNPEDPSWASNGKSLSWRTLFITTFCLLLSFSTWFMVSAIVVKLQSIGFKLEKSELFWLTATPGIAAGTLRIVHTFLIPIFGTRKTVSIATLLLIIPCLGWYYAIQNPATPYPVLLALAFIAGLGGGNFSSFMPSTSLFFPKRMLGTALGIQAGIGNFGVSVAQFVIPWIIGFSLLGSALGFFADQRCLWPTEDDLAPECSHCVVALRGDRSRCRLALAQERPCKGYFPRANRHL